MTGMSKTEYLISGTVLGLFIPFAIMIVIWWPLATLTIYRIIRIPDVTIMICSLAGLFTGIVIDILVLKKIIPKFYEMNKLILIITYLLCSAFAVSSFMGLPVGNLCLGFIAGLYTGRKCRHFSANPDHYSHTLKTVSHFTALITSFEGLLTGFIMLNDKSALLSANQFLGLQVFSAGKVNNVLIIILLCIILYVLQFFITKAAVTLSYQVRMKPD